MLDQATFNGLINRITNYLHGLYTKAATQANVITSLLTNIQRLAERMAANEVGLQTVLNVDLVGGIMQCVGTLDPFNPASNLYQLCDGSQLPTAAAFDKCGNTLTEAEITSGAFYRINYMMWEMGKSLGNTGENWDEFNPLHAYNVPDLRGYFLVGSSMGKSSDIDERTKAIDLYKKDGEKEVALDEEHLTPHTHRIYINAGSGNAGTIDKNSRGGDDGGVDQYWAWIGQAPRPSGNPNDRFALKYKSGKEQFGNTEAKGHPNMPPYFAVNYYIRILK